MARSKSGRPPAKGALGPRETRPKVAQTMAKNGATEVTSADERRSKIIEAAREVLAAKGYSGMTTLDVARRAGISKRDLYQRFSSKDALIVAMVAASAKEMLEPVELGSPETREAFYAILQAFGRKFLSDMLSERRLRFYRVAIAEVETNPAMAKAILTEGTEATTERVRQLFVDAEQRGLARFVDREAAIGAYFYSLMGDLMINALLSPKFTQLEALIGRQVGLALLVTQRLELPERQ